MHLLFIVILCGSSKAFAVCGQYITCEKTSERLLAIKLSFVEVVLRNLQITPIVMNPYRRFIDCLLFTNY